jgi:proteasome accessory factor B
VVEKVERLLNLTVALLEARRPVTFAEIRRRIAGYDHAEFESARRMFERDKDELRSLGVPVRTVEAPRTDADVGYTVDRSEYELGEIDLDADEVAALAIALHLTGEERARLGLAKIAALSPDPRTRGEVVPARIDPGLEDLDEISTALVERRAIRFAYRSSVGELSHRTIDPYGIGQRSGAWYLVGRDHDRDAQRVFRLDRLAGRPVPVGAAGAFEPPGDLDVAAAVSGPVAAAVDIVVAVDPAVAWRLERGGSVTGEHDDGRTEITFQGADPDRVLPRVLALGEAVEVLAPPDVRAEAAARLRAVAGDRR